MQRQTWKLQSESDARSLFILVHCRHHSSSTNSPRVPCSSIRLSAFHCLPRIPSLPGPTSAPPLCRSTSPNRQYMLGTFLDTVELTTPHWRPPAAAGATQLLTSFKLPLATSRAHAPPPLPMAAAAVTSPDPFTFHPHISPSVADGDGDEFEFRVPAAAAALSAADELFCGGKLVPLLPPPPPQPLSPPCSPPPCLEVEPASEPASPRAPRCAGRRWRDLLLLVTKKAKPGAGGDKKCGDGGCLMRRGEIHFRPLLSRDSSSSSSASSSADSGKAARRPPPPSPRSPLRTRSAPVSNLLHLISRRPASDDKTGSAVDDAPTPLKRLLPCTQHPLLTRASSSSSASSSDSTYGRNRPRAAARTRPAVAAESPLVSASGRVVFRGLERCSSTPASAGIDPMRRPRPRRVERSYSANVRVDPVINVFGFGQLFMPSSPAKQEKKTDRDGAGRRGRPEKLAMVLRDPQD